MYLLLFLFFVFFSFYEALTSDGERDRHIFRDLRNEICMRRARYWLKLKIYSSALFWMVEARAINVISQLSDSLLNDLRYNICYRVLCVYDMQ